MRSHRGGMASRSTCTGR